jgi:hypothetical protein
VQLVFGFCASVSWRFWSFNCAGRLGSDDLSLLFSLPGLAEAYPKRGIVAVVELAKTSASALLPLTGS